MSNEEQKSPEQLAEEKQLHDQALAIESQKFMRGDGRDMLACQENADLMGKYITEGKLQWDVTNLSAVYAEHNGEFKKVPSAPAPVVVVEQKDPYADFAWGQLTKQSIAAMNREDYRRLIKNGDFERHVNRVQAGLPQLNKEGK